MTKKILKLLWNIVPATLAVYFAWHNLFLIQSVAAVLLLFYIATCVVVFLKPPDSTEEEK